MGRAPCCDKANVKKGPWSPEEDEKLKTYIHQNGTGGNWISLPQKIGLKRCGKSCRLRWLNYLRPNIKHGDFSDEEDNIICSLYIHIGSRWSIIATQLPGRTDNDIKNYWNTRLKKKLLGKNRKNGRRGKMHGEQPENYYTVPGITNQTEYWPELPQSLPESNSNHENQIVSTNFQYPFDISFQQQQFANSITSMDWIGWQNTHFGVNGSGQKMGQEFDNFEIELSEMIYNDPPQDLLDWSDIKVSSYENCSFQDSNFFGF